MFEYIKQDPRYDWLKNQKRQIILAWAQREYKNLKRATTAKINVPKPLGWKNHIIVEELIGNPAPPLKDAFPAYPHQFLQDLIAQIKKLYTAGMVHGDLSAFNILNHNEKPILIDFSQTTLLRAPNSHQLLERDIKNICAFFNKYKIKCDPQEILQQFFKREEH